MFDFEFFDDDTDSCESYDFEESSEILDFSHVVTSAQVEEYHRERNMWKLEISKQKRKRELRKLQAKSNENLNLRITEELTPSALAWEWMFSKHLEILTQVENPKLSNIDYSRLFNKAVKYDQKKHSEGLISLKVAEVLTHIYKGMRKVVREYGRLSEYTLKQQDTYSPVGKQKSEYRLVIQQSCKSVATSKTMKHSQPVGSIDSKYAESLGRIDGVDKFPKEQGKKRIRRVRQSNIPFKLT